MQYPGVVCDLATPLCTERNQKKVFARPAGRRKPTRVEESVTKEISYTVGRNPRMEEEMSWVEEWRVQRTALVPASVGSELSVRYQSG